MRRAFQPFQEIRPHHSDEKALAVLLVGMIFLPDVVQLGRVGNIRRGLIDGQPELLNALGQLDIGQSAGQVRRRVCLDRLGAFRELPDAFHFGGVELLHQPPGTGNGHAVQQPQKIGAQPVQQLRLIPPPRTLYPAPAATATTASTLAPPGRPGAGNRSRFPFPELPLRRRHHRADIAHPQALPESVLPPLGHQVNLIA